MNVIRAFLRIDLLVRLLLLAILLASLWPVTGDGRTVARAISEGGIFVLFLLNGLRLPRKDVAAGLKNARFLAPLTLWCFGAMGLVGIGLWQIASDIIPVEVTLGLLFLGFLPSTVQSATAYCSIAGGNVATSVVAAGLLNVLGVFVTASLFSAVAGSEIGGLDFAALQRIGLILILPFVIGQLVQGLGDGFAARWVQSRKSLVGWADKLVIATAVYVAFSGAVEQGLWSRVDGFAWAVLLGLVGVFLIVGFGGSWGLGALLGLARGERISFLFAGAQKSLALGAPLASLMFAPELAGMLLLPLLVYHMLQLVISAIIAGRFSQS